MHDLGQSLGVDAATAAEVRAAIGKVEFKAPPGHLFVNFLPKRTFQYWLSTGATVLVNVTQRTRGNFQFSHCAYFGMRSKQHAQKR